MLSLRYSPSPLGNTMNTVLYLLACSGKSEDTASYLDDLPNDTSPPADTNDTTDTNDTNDTGPTYGTTHAIITTADYANGRSNGTYWP